MDLKLNNPSLLQSGAYIDGSFVSRQKTFAVNNPSTGELIANVADCSRSDVIDAINAAKTAQKAWGKRTGKDRAQVLRRWFDLLIENADDLAAILTAEMGKPVAEAKGEILYGASFIEWFSEEAKRVYGDTIPGHQEDKRIMVIKQPVGVVGAITPWNFPNAMITRKAAPALAAGCAMIVKPAAETPLSALALASLAEQAGIPKGVLSILPSTDAVAVGEELCTNDIVQKISFTGSTNVGRILMRQSADQIKKLSLELGGNAPFIVFNDADLDKAVEGALISKFRNAGQTCVCSNRIYVQDGVYDAFANKLADAVRNLNVGDGFQSGVTIGPLITEAAVQKVESHIKNALENGASIVCGGERSDKGGTFFEPTVLTNVTSEMDVAREETFGPLAPLFRFKEVDEAIAAANDTEFGLASYFYSNDLSTVYKVAEELEYGMVGVNTGLISTEVAPFGGVKQSGLGREGSKYGIEDYVEMKYICISV
ncbi:succinate-semialdehyde dehydrogenase / glutarate-semialdehyde dehydrogenase [Pseudovibrio ascidiaceicola]|uniref:Succinate-semialdehyde dehydrogenase / glutarate-semialdehyde dehydrogenase n=1 Tax=Pseudovibrio ascidiaceicola TaxID=285279 RepID=A0A1I4DUC9_9HYPH|nr:NAD-dependent succinate-semialdehyde dehydrogenase [Pseudovibrio ascidiaceicola]SFK95847.1 succinate-semialdehyde dehydrogenase / glutarate-semialdehyde dehydrogenase [Pseudovibrio ascidiaceicola]